MQEILPVFRDKEKYFSLLCKEVSSCDLCPRMKDSARILSMSAGNLNAKIMFIGEAPGRLGADASGIPFHGDKSGHNFEAMLEMVGIHRSDIFITNAALCNPKDDSGNNAPPSSRELDNCSNFMKEQINIVNPKIIATLGAKALQALALIEEHDLELKQAVRKKHKWFGRILIPLYHPGQRAMMHRSYINQQSDYKFLAEESSRLGKTKNRKHQKSVGSIVALASEIIGMKGNVSYFALHKLAYLAELEFYKLNNRRLTNGYYVRQKDGPYCTDLHIAKIKPSINGLVVKNIKGKVYLSIPPVNNNDSGIPIKELISKYKDKTDEELKTISYLSRPMKRLLRKEREKINTYNSSIDFN